MPAPPPLPRELHPPTKGQLVERPGLVPEAQGLVEGARGAVPMPALELEVGSRRWPSTSRSRLPYSEGCSLFLVVVGSWALEGISSAFDGMSVG